MIDLGDDYNEEESEEGINRRNLNSYNIFFSKKKER